MDYCVKESEYERHINGNENKLICFANENKEKLINDIVLRMHNDNLVNLEILVSDINSYNIGIANDISEKILDDRIALGEFEMDHEYWLDIESFAEESVMPYFFTTEFCSDDIENMVYDFMTENNISIYAEGYDVFSYPVFLTRINKDIVELQYDISGQFFMGSKFVANHPQKVLFENLSTPILSYGEDTFIFTESEMKEEQKLKFIGDGVCKKSV